MARRRYEYNQQHSSRDRWLVSYADFITLLFGFFVVMYSVSQVNETKYQELSTTLASAFESLGGSSELQKMSESIDKPSSEQLPANATKQYNEADLIQLEELIEQVLSQHNSDDAQSVVVDGDWIEISLDAGLLFESASASIDESAKPLFAQVAPVLNAVDDVIEVGGHTDNISISNNQFGSNWELSSARAVAVVEELTKLGVDPARLRAVGYGQYRPVVPNDSDEGRAKNRRVVLKLSRSLKDGASLDALGPLIETDEGPVLDNVESMPEEPVDTVPVVEPVLLNNGGLLFTTDPEPEKKQR